MGCCGNGDDGVSVSVRLEISGSAVGRSDRYSIHLSSGEFLGKISKRRKKLGEKSWCLAFKLKVEDFKLSC